MMIRNITIIITLIIIIILAIIILIIQNLDENNLSNAIDAYIYGYPLITMEMTRKLITNTIEPEINSNKFSIPMGYMGSTREYPKPGFKTVVSPNVDTLYSVAWLDLTNCPYIFSIPNPHTRYVLFEIIDGWTNVIADPGTRTFGNTSKQTYNYIIIGPDYKGYVPRNMTRIKSPTNLVWIIGRTYSSGTKEDYEKVYALQDKYKIVPLKCNVPVVAYDKNFDMNKSTPEHVAQLDAGTYFSMLANLMGANPPQKQDENMIKNLAKLGIYPGKKFDINKVNPKIKTVLEKAPKLALMKIKNYGRQTAQINSWKISYNAGDFGTNYLQRAFVALNVLGANLPEDALYYHAETDVNGQLLNGKDRYTITFGKDELPPVNAFWSITMYDEQNFLVPNSLNRYSLGSRSQFKYNKDGSLTIFIQHDEPGVDSEQNWLPPPTGLFKLILRLYWPKQEVLDKRWNVPDIRKSTPKDV